MDNEEIVDVVKSEPGKVIVVSRSPVPNRKPVTYSFPDAMREVLNGKRITRLEWGTNDTYGALHDTFLELFIRGEWHAWTVNDGDMNAIDWVTLPEVN